MGRRKGELSKAAIDHEYPHQVVLPADQCGGTQQATHEIICANLSLAPCRHSVRRDDQWYIVFCFAEQQHAAYFQSIFGGELFDPKNRGRGRSWFKWRTSKRSDQ